MWLCVRESASVFLCARVCECVCVCVGVCVRARVSHYSFKDPGVKCRHSGGGTI